MVVCLESIHSKNKQSQTFFCYLKVEISKDLNETVPEAGDLEAGLNLLHQDPAPSAVRRCLVIIAYSCSREDNNTCSI